MWITSTNYSRIKKQSSLKSESTGENKSRAGRDLPAAIAVGLTLVGVVLASIFLLKPSFVAIVVIAISLGIVEISRAFKAAGIELPLIPILTGGIVMMVAAYLEGVEASAVAMALTVIGTLIWRLAGGAEGFVRDSSAGIFVLSYLPLMAVFVVLLLAEEDGAWRIVAFILVTVASDIGGYAVGVLFGKHPMAATISPKKSWEGFAGSAVVGMVAGFGIVVYGLDGRWWVGLLLGAAAVVMATFGDLSESLIKRDLGIKDMGNLLPGHGGIMDRLDSLVAVAPVAWLIMHYLVPVV